MKNTYYKWAVWLFLSGFGLLLILSLLFAFKTTKIDFTAPLATDVWDNYGSVVGGLVGALFSLASILLLIHTIQEQELEGHRQKIESRFFELLKIHRENCAQIQLEDKVGRYAIARMFREFRLCLNKATALTQKMQLEYTGDKILNFAYLAFYFGSADLSNPKKKFDLSQPSQEKSKIAAFMDHVLDYDPAFVNEFIEWSTKERDKLKQDYKFKHRLFSGHQIRLSQYFRHLFQSIKFINNQTKITYAEKYEYIKTLRAQLSPQEQVLLFCASKSVLGYEWEENHPNDPNKQLITKYNLIKNIPWRGYDLEKYYPCVEYENSPVPPCRAALIKKYK